MTANTPWNQGTYDAPNVESHIFRLPGIHFRKYGIPCSHETKILDFGCGYGAVGISIAKQYKPGLVVMSDINQRAIKLAGMNAKAYGLKNVSIISSGCFENIDKKQRFDTILLNPPQSAGRKLCDRMIEESRHYLKKTGFLQVVARHNKGGKEFEKKMKGVFGNCKTIAKSAGYRVYVSGFNPKP